MSVNAGNEFGGHMKRAHLVALLTTGGTEATFAAEGNKLKLTAFRAAEHGTSEGGITTVNHLFDIFENR